MGRKAGEDGGRLCLMELGCDGTTSVWVLQGMRFGVASEGSSQASEVAWFQPLKPRG